MELFSSTHVRIVTFRMVGKGAVAVGVSVNTPEVQMEMKINNTHPSQYRGTGRILEW